MSFSSQILTFLVVSAIYVGFTFVWAWYKGKQDEEEAAATAAEDRRVAAERDDRMRDSEREDTMNSDTDDDRTAENGGER